MTSLHKFDLCVHRPFRYLISILLSYYGTVRNVYCARTRRLWNGGQLLGMPGTIETFLFTGAKVFTKGVRGSKEFQKQGQIKCSCVWLYENTAPRLLQHYLATMYICSLCLYSTDLVSTYLGACICATASVRRSFFLSGGGGSPHFALSSCLERRV